MIGERLHQLWLRVKGLFRRNQLERDLEDEISFHLAMREHAVRSGQGVLSNLARIGFGNATRIKEETRDQWVFAGLENIWRDIVYGIRVLGRSPAFTAVAILTLALGIGVNAAIFSIFNGAVFRPLPVQKAGELFSIAQEFSGKYSRNVSGEGSLVSFPEYKAYSEQNEVFSGLTAFAPFRTVTLGGVHKRRLSGVLASCNYFIVLPMRTQLGRALTESDCNTPGAGAVVVLNDRIWRSVFDADPTIIGKPITLNRTPVVVVGVAPPGFDGTEVGVADYWVPFTMQDALYPLSPYFSKDNMSWLKLIGRAKPGVGAGDIQVNFGVIAAQLGKAYPKRRTQISVRSATMFDLPEERTIVLSIGAVVLIVVSLVLVIVCTNLANLLLARAASRGKEMGVRLTLGASRGRLIRQLLTENLIVAITGGVIGTMLALWFSAFIVRLVTARIESTEIGALRIDVGPDWRILLYSFVVSLITGLAFGLAPALRASRVDLNTAMKSEGVSSPKRKLFTGRFLVGVQVAVCMVLLLVTGLVLRGLYHVQTIEPGFAMQGINTVSLDLVSQGYSVARAPAFQQKLKDRLRALPGVDAVAQCVVTPLSDNHWQTQFQLEGDSESRDIELNYVSPGYLSILGIPIVRGRDFTEREVTDNTPAVIVTEAMARKFWPGQDPLGKTGRLDNRIVEVIGVAADASVTKPSVPHPVFLYAPAGPEDQVKLITLVHSSLPVANLASEIRNATQALDPDLLVEVLPLDANLEVWRTPSIIVATTGAVLGTLALCIASLGLFGMVSYGVTRRLREIGIRMALGAEGSDVRNMIVRQALRPVIIGVAIGVVACAAVSKIISAVLYGVSAHDPIAFVAAPMFLLFIALIACYLPARRAMRLDPMKILRHE
jgi:predicted permease